MGFILLNLAIISIIIFLLVVLSMIWPPDSPWAPWWRTSSAKAREILKLAKVSKKDIVYELGSGEATFLITAAKEFGAKGVGIEIDPLRTLLARLSVRLNGVSNKVKIIRGNFFNQNISEASIVFVYLVPKTLEKLKPKFLKELKKGTKILSFRYKINLPLRKEDKKHKIYLYQR